MPCGMLEAATILRSQPPRLSEVGAPLLTAGRETTKGAVTPVPKVAPLPAQIFTPSKTLAMACANFTITTPIGLTGVLHLVLGRKTYFAAGPLSVRRKHIHMPLPRLCIFPPTQVSFF